MIGWVGAICFGLTGLPQALRAHKDGHADGLSVGFLWLWSLGEIFTAWAVIQDAPVPYLLWNYAMNALFLAIMWKYKIWPRVSTTPVIPISRGRQIRRVCETEKGPA